MQFMYAQLEDNTPRRVMIALAASRLIEWCCTLIGVALGSFDHPDLCAMSSEVPKDQVTKNFFQSLRTAFGLDLNSGALALPKYAVNILLAAFQFPQVLYSGPGCDQSGFDLTKSALVMHFKPDPTDPKARIPFFGPHPDQNPQRKAGASAFSCEVHIDLRNLLFNIAFHRQNRRFPAELEEFTRGVQARSLF